MDFDDVEEFATNTARIEWRIENFDCWHSDYHEPYIESPSFALVPDFKIILDPKVTEESDKIKLSCSFASLRFYPGELGYFANDKQFQSEEFDGTDGEDSVIFMAPNFSKIPRKEEEVMNYITLLFRFEVPQPPISVCMCTTVELISRIIIYPFPLSRLLEPNPLLAITCESGEDMFYVHTIGDKSKAIDLQIRPVSKWSFHKMLIKSRLRIFDSGCLILAEDCPHLFEKVGGIGGEPWTIARISLEEILPDTIDDVTLDLKFISGKITSCAHCAVDAEPDDASSGESSSSKPSIPLLSVEKRPSSLGEELMLLCQDREFTDCELRCQDSKFPVHRAILSARSPVFKRMFLSNRKGKTNSVLIKDLEPPTLNKFLTFLYTGTVKDLQVDTAIKLYHAADQYQVPTLKAECVSFLSGNISVSNACSVLSLADKCKNPELTLSVRNFIMDNFKLVSESEEWRSFMKTDPKLLVKTVTEIAINGYF